MLSATEVRERTRINAHKKLYTDIEHVANLGWFASDFFLTNEHKLELEQLGYTVDGTGASGPNMFNISWENPTNQNDSDMSAAKMYAKAYDASYTRLVNRINTRSDAGIYYIHDVILTTSKLRDQLESLGYSVSPYGTFGNVSISWN